MSKIIPVILSGGSGTRLWPMSTPERPKQFLSLTGNVSMFQATAARCADRELFDPPIVVGSARHADLVDTQLGEAGRAQALILEPCARNTAPAIAMAALAVASDAPLLVMPSDHAIGDEAAFHAAIAAALPFANEGWLVTFGIAPTHAETGYGYIEMADPLADDVRRAARFREKPDAESATAMLADGRHVWNGGIFLFRADAYLAALAAHAPDILAAATHAFEGAVRNGNRIAPTDAAFAECRSESIDYAVMEKAERVAVVPVAMGWSDVGSWDALYAIGTKDADGNAIVGDVRIAEGSGNLVRSDGLRVSMLGVDDLIVVASGNEVMIVPRGRAQDVKRFSVS